MTKVLEGTWAEIRAQQPDWETKRLRVEVLEAPETQDAPVQNGEPSLFDEMKDLVGTASFEPTDLAERNEYYCALAMNEKYPDDAKQTDDSS